MEDNVLKIKLKDTHYLASWDKKDLDLINKLQAKIRNGERSQELGDLFFKILDSKYNDHHPTPEPLQVSVDKKYIMTFKGVGRFCQLITGQSTARPAVVAVGSGTATPTAVDTVLQIEVEYIEIATNGFLDASGTTIRYCGTFGADVETVDISESLLRDQVSVSGATVFCRNTFANQPIDHDAGNAGFSAAGVFEFQVVA